MKVSVIIPCKGRLDHLKESFTYLSNQRLFNLEVIIVDYNCPQQTYKWVESEQSEWVQCVRANVSPDEWSLAAARNLGYKHSSGEMLLFLDADAKLIDRDFIEKHVNHCIDGSFICGWGWHDATGCLMIRRSAFKAVKGYNEAIKSWGFEDIDIYNRLEKELAQERRIWLGGIETIKHGDELRNIFHGNAPTQATNELNYHISQSKFIGIYGEEKREVSQ